MKILLFGMFLVLSLSMTAQELSKNSQNLKENYPELFSSIKEYSSSKWKNDSVKMIYEVNNQAEAFTEVCRLVIDNFTRNRLCLEAIKQRTADRKNIRFIDPSINWEEVLFDLKQQVNIRTAF